MFYPLNNWPLCVKCMFAFLQHRRITLFLIGCDTSLQFVHFSGEARTFWDGLAPEPRPPALDDRLQPAQVRKEMKRQQQQQQQWWWQQPSKEGHSRKIFPRLQPKKQKNRIPELNFDFLQQHEIKLSLFFFLAPHFFFIFGRNFGRFWSHCWEIKIDRN